MDRDFNWKIFWYVFFFTAILIILLGSCSPAKYCARKFPPKIDTTYFVSYDTSIVYRDTTIYVTLPRRVEYVPRIIPVEVIGEISQDTVMAQSNYAIAMAWLSYKPNELTQHLLIEDKDTTLQIKLDSAIVERDYWKSEYTKVGERIVIKQKPKVKIIIAFLLGIIIGLIICRRR